MNKIEPDQFTGSLSALNIKSTLQIPSQNSNSTISSETCGLGWTFELHGSQAGISSSYYGGYSYLQGPYKLSMAFGSLSQTTTYQLASVECELQVPNYGTVTHLSKKDTLPGPSLYIGDIAQYTVEDYGNATLTCTVILRPLPAATPSKLVAERISAVTLGSLDGQNFVDTKVYAYTRRSSGGAINPRPIFIHSTIIDQYGCKPLSLLFGKAEGLLSEDALLDLHRLPESQETLAALDYRDDSDLEDEDTVDAPEYPLQSLFDWNAASKKSKKKFTNAASSAAHDPTLPNILRDVPHSEILDAVGQCQNALRYGRIKVLSNGAYRTWHAIIRYIYTGSIEFAPIRSTKRPRPTPEACSPKSVYRIADEYGMDTLKQMAYKEIIGGITAENVIDELFSYFAHMYPAVHDHGMKVLLEKKSDPTVRGAIMERSNSHGEGTMEPHEKETMNKIMAQLI
ncbi:hypothetical protein CYLTODRAFT_494941 [Cylindrobasidium torrendii FP15055 ss-10]|uniref:BTB domain-containing protein n=1 Tax=Cylindrobasidium torrendii FP15055 ss-10 TaxID=1314674 RepID=A0A0D7AUE1_9AGAR|nr:hypothetical protein CYLTODRAFT_494941 [Cylindrobasidium torrendii FP15055 ss-10]